MAVFTITIPDADLPRLLAAIARNGGWLASSGLTRRQFANQFFRSMLQNMIVAHETQDAGLAITPPDVTVG